MVSWKRVCSIVALAILGSAASAGAQSLKIGDPAPKLAVKSFVKGEPVKGFDPGKNYVVEFWATWCGPCKATIPHLTELQKKYPDVTFIGVSVFEQDQDAVEPFVKEMGEKMAYRVALDAVPEGKERGEGAMAVSWMKAAEQAGIPTAFVVNKEGQIAWIGHPMGLDKPLEKIVAGNWDVKTAAEEIRKEKENQGRLQKLAQRLGQAQRSGDAKQVLALLDEIVGIQPQLEPQLGPLRLGALIKLDEQDKALELAKQLLDGPMGKNPAGLNALAWTIVDPDAKSKPNAKLIQVALEAARKADELAGGKEGAIADTLAKAYFDSGDAAKALETQERAIRLMKEGGQPVDPSMQERLEQYKKATQK
jgi:thiol-disulfide isomerase/thioredoxin